MIHTYRLITLAFFGSIGVTFLILACALPQYNQWWPFFTILFYLASPIPTMISKRQNYDNSSCLEFSIFLTVGIVLSSFALPIVLSLAGIIATGACVLTILGNVVVYFTLLGFFLAFQEDVGWQI
ncbi:unnamed protein product [Chironomus riparius]|uniref:Leptin receptor gene-related protein n=1 Tax=Chironomus riparius TaxID=315576 RepID=A0A9N9WNS0_9DIPT|nr:unnamed protein product [Chironomus riparius]